MNKLRDIECFIAVADSGSFIKAADRLGVSRAAISRTVIGLESRLGSRLLQRSTRRVALTPVGHQYLERCKHVVQALREADEQVGADAFEPSGRLRIHAPLSFGMLHLAPLWPRFLQRYPGIQLEVELSDQLTDLPDETYDLAIRISSRQRPSLVHRPLGRTELLVCAAPSYLLQHGQPKHPLELADHAVVGYTYFTGRDQWQFDSVGGPVVVRTQGPLNANNGDTCLVAAKAGLGIILQPSFLVADAVQRGELVVLLQDYPLGSIGIDAVFPSRRLLPHKARAVLEFLIESMRTAPWNADQRDSQVGAICTPRPAP